MKARSFPDSGRKAHVAVETEFENGVFNHFTKGECNYRSDGTAAFIPNEDIDQQSFWPIDRETTAILGQSWNDEAGMPFTAVKAVAHVYPNGMIAIGLCEKQPSCQHKPRYRAVRKRVVVTDHGIVREGASDITLRVRITKDNLTSSSDSIRERLDREVFKLLSQLPN